MVILAIFTTVTVQYARWLSWVFKWVCYSSSRLYKERLSQVDIKLQEVMAGCAQEYLEPLANLQENMQIRTKVAGRTNSPPPPNFMIT